MSLSWNQFKDRVDKMLELLNKEVDPRINGDLPIHDIDVFAPSEKPEIYINTHDNYSSLDIGVD